MPDYCTQADLESRFGAAEILELADRDGDGVADAGVVPGAIGDAAAAIDSYIGGRYDLPIATVPPALTRIACDLARYYLHGNLPTETVTENYKFAVAALRDIATGKAVLDVGGQQPAPSPAQEVRYAGADRTFNRDTLGDY